MKFTLGWLKDYLMTDASLDEILVTLNSIGLEVEEVVDRSKDFDSFIVAEILDTKKHPNADKLRICSVNTGDHKLQIVCGAANARKGIKVVLAPIGTIMPNGMKIKPVKIRDIESSGMLCSADELGLDETSDGIIELNETAKTGSKIADLFGLNDPMIEIAITPNRADCLGVYGVARDLVAAGIGSLKKPKIPVIPKKGDSPIGVMLDDKKRCPQFLGRYFKGVTNGPSPEWLQNRLRAIGLTPISSLVDITNYISYSYGRPLHVFDAAKLKGNVVVREARIAEKFTALDDKIYTTQGGETVVADDSGIIAFGGIIGGKDSGCTLETSEVFLEVAYFDPIITAETGRKHQIETDARYRFERKVDPAFMGPGGDIASQMILDLCGGSASSLVVAGEDVIENTVINFPVAKVESLGGIKIPNNTIVDILEKLGFKVRGEGLLEVTVPSYRADVTMVEDLVEEVLRIYGYHEIEEIHIAAKDGIPSKIIPSFLKNQKNVRRNLVQRGYFEAVTFSFTDTAKISKFTNINKDQELLNPISSDLSYMRPSIIPNLLIAQKKNSNRGFHNISLFEIGPIYKGVGANDQETVVAGMRSGRRNVKNMYAEERPVDVFDIKADIFAAIEECGFNPSRLTVDQHEKYCWYHPGKSAVLKIGKQTIGYFGELHPAVSKEFGIAEAVVIFEFYIDRMPKIKSKKGKRAVAKFSDFQAVERDFAFMIDNQMAVGSLLKVIDSTEKNLIRSSKIFDIYSGKGVESGKKSVAVTVSIQAYDKTLTDE